MASLSLAPFSLWSAKDEQWQLATVVPALQRTLVSGLQSEYGDSLVDFRLECNQIDGELFAQVDRIRTDCTGQTMFDASHDTIPTELELGQAQVGILKNTTSLSNQLSTEVGWTAEVSQVIVELQPEEEATEAREVESGKYASRNLTMTVVVATALVVFLQVL